MPTNKRGREEESLNSAIPEDDSLYFKTAEEATRSRMFQRSLDDDTTTLIAETNTLEVAQALLYEVLFELYMLHINAKDAWLGVDHNTLLETTFYLQEGKKTLREVLLEVNALLKIEKNPNLSIIEINKILSNVIRVDDSDNVIILEDSDINNIINKIVILL